MIHDAFVVIHTIRYVPSEICYIFFSWLHSEFLMHRRGLITHIIQGWISGKCMGALDWYQSRTNHDKAPVTILPENNFINNNHRFPLRIYLVFYSDLDELVPMQIHTRFRLFETLGRTIIPSRWRQIVIPPWLVTIELTCQRGIITDQAFVNRCVKFQ